MTRVANPFGQLREIYVQLALDLIKFVQDVRIILGDADSGSRVDVCVADNFLAPIEDVCQGIWEIRFTDFSYVDLIYQTLQIFN